MEENPTVTGEFTARYTIERELGRGGAAVVYLARDNRQERHVAIKVLHKELAQAIGAQRFLREIKHSSALQHPHLLTILDSGESRGTLYFVMPYMPDGSLRTRIAREKQLPIDDALRITKDVGEALAYAHSQGIVHRDIKPDNVLFSADHACLADFGIARAMDSVAADTLTSTGLVVGTPAYMSPEQASGEKVVDARSDQYSLACLLYEMITGLPPFIGATQQSVISQRFTQPPPSMRAHRPNVPDHVERAVKRALAVVPADRFPGAKEFVEALHAPGAASEPVSVHRIRRRWFAVGAAAAVVTLAVVAAKPGAEWVRGLGGAQVDTTKFVVLPFFSDDDPALGKQMGGGLQAALSEWDSLSLKSDVEVREALAEVDGEISSAPNAIAVARDLGAGRLIWGTVGIAGDRIRVVARLYDVNRAVELKEQTFLLERKAIPDSAMHALASDLLASGALPARFDDGYNGTRVYPALLAYRRGIMALSRYELDSAHAEFMRAVELDADFAVAHLELARVLSWLRPTEAATWLTSTRRAVALRNELTLRDATRASALMAYGQKDYPRACGHYRQMIRADTLDAHAWYGLGECLHADGVVVVDTRSPSNFRFRTSWHEAGSAFLKAVELDAGLHAAVLFQRLTQLFPSAHNQIRSGAATIDNPDGFGARPSLAADTLAFRPYPRPNFEQERSPAAKSLHRRALERNRRIMLEFTNTWVRTYPQSAEAHAARAAILEVRGDWNGAVANLTTARRFAKTPFEKLLFADAEARVRLKDADFVGARRAADSGLASANAITEDNWEIIARLAGLTGKSTRFGEALTFFWSRYAQAGDDLHQDLSRAAGRALGNAAFELCEARPQTVERSLSEMVRIHVEPQRQAAVNERVVGLVLSFMLPCGTQLGAVNGPGDVVRAQRAYVAGELEDARTILREAATERKDLLASEMSPNFVTREAALLLRLGDTSAAITRIDGTLNGLSGMSASTLKYPLETAIIVQMMVTRADLAMATGDVYQARKWASIVAVLWGESDPALRPTFSRMRIFAARRR